MVEEDAFIKPDSNILYESKDDFTQVFRQNIPPQSDSSVTKPQPVTSISGRISTHVGNKIDTKSEKSTGLRAIPDTLVDTIKLNKDYKNELHSRDSIIRGKKSLPSVGINDTSHTTISVLSEPHSNSLVITKRLEMMPTYVDYFNSIIGPLIVALVTGLFTWVWTKKIVKRNITTKYQCKVDSAPVKYVQELDKLINKAVSDGEENATINARAIVAARNSLRDSLITISKQLNSEIDRLEQDINDEKSGKKIFRMLEEDLYKKSDLINPGIIFETIKVLHAVWPTKKVQIEVEVRKLITELGLNELDA